MRKSSSASTRALTRQSGLFVRASRGSSALERGLRLLRAFLGGAAGLTNAELAERCGLPRSTVSRLVRSLVDEGFLEYDIAQSAYRLAPVSLSLAGAYRRSHSCLSEATALLREVAVRERVNLSLALADGLQMVYLDSFREGTGPVQRVVPPGSRVPIECYASGHAVLAAMAPAVRARVLSELERSRGAGWPRQHAALQRSARQCERHGYCVVPSTPGLVAIATALHAPDGTLCAIVLTGERRDAAEALPRILMSAAGLILTLWA